MKAAAYARRIKAAEAVRFRPEERVFQINDPGSEDAEQRQHARDDYHAALSWELGSPYRRARMFEVMYVSPGDTAEDEAAYRERKAALLAEVREELNAPERAPLYPPCRFAFVDPEPRH